MNHKLQHRFNRLEADRLRLLNALQALTTEQFNYASPGKWSISQILAHLIAAEKTSVSYMNHKFGSIDQLDNTGIAETIKIALLKISQRLPLKFKAPAVVVSLTPAYDNLEHLALTWQRDRAALRQLLEKFDQVKLRKKIYNHIVVGRLNIEQALIFFKEHFFHHLPQIRRLS